MHNQGKREKLIAEYRDLLKKSREASSEDDKKKFSDLAHEKHNEILIEQFGDKNFGRFTFPYV